MMVLHYLIPTIGFLLIKLNEKIFYSVGNRLDGAKLSSHYLKLNRLKYQFHNIPTNLMSYWFGFFIVIKETVGTTVPKYENVKYETEYQFLFLEFRSYNTSLMYVRSTFQQFVETIGQPVKLVLQSYQLLRTTETQKRFKKTLLGKISKFFSMVDTYILQFHDNKCKILLAIMNCVEQA